MTKYEVRVTQTNVDFYHVEANNKTEAKANLLTGLLSGRRGNIVLDDTIKRQPIVNYVVQLTPEGEIIYD